MVKRTGISRPTITFWYNGQRTPDAESLIILSKALNLSADYLLGLSDDPRIQPIATDELHLSSAAVEQMRQAVKFDVLNPNDANCPSAIVSRLLADAHFWYILDNIAKAKEAALRIRDTPDSAGPWLGEAAMEANKLFRAKTGCAAAEMLHGEQYLRFLEFEIDGDVKKLIQKELAGIQSNGKL